MAAIGFGRRSYVVLAWLFVAGTVVQVYFAGLGLLVDPTQLRLHVSLGNILHSIVLLQLVLAFTARLPRPIAGLTVLQNVLFFAQYAFIHAHGGGNLFAWRALHPVNGLALLTLGLHLALAAGRHR